MELEHKLEKILLERYGITRDNIDEALKNEQEVDLGIFVTGAKRYEEAI